MTTARSQPPTLRITRAGPRAAPTFHTLQRIPSGDAGVSATLDVMRSLVRTWSKNPTVRNLAKQITAHVPEKNWSAEAAALHAFVRDRIKYIRDPEQTELVQAPDVTLRDRSGDCDDQAVLLGALLQSVGHPVRFVAVGFDQFGPFSHVFLETRIGGYWRAAETTEAGWPIGRYPVGIRRHMFKHV